jgi:hypothetical protein
MSLNNEKASDEDRMAENSAQGNHSSRLQLIDLSNDEGTATGSPTDLLTWDDNNAIENEYEYNNDFIGGHPEESDKSLDLAGAAIDPRLLQTYDLYPSSFDWYLTPRRSMDNFTSTNSRDDLSNGGYGPWSPGAGQEMNDEPFIFNDSTSFEINVPFQNRSDTLAGMGLDTLDPSLQSFLTVQPFQIVTQPHQPATENFQTTVSPLSMSVPSFQLTNQTLYDRQVVAKQLVPSPPTQAEKQPRSKKNTESKSPSKKTKGNGHIEGFDRRTGKPTLVGTYPADHLIRDGKDYWLCRDQRCINRDGTRPSWTTKNGYKFHLGENCLQNPMSKRSLQLAAGGVDRKRKRTTVKRLGNL